MDVSDQEIRMKLENSKPQNIPGTQMEKSGGIGQRNVRKQLDLLYPNNYTLNILESPYNYAVDLKINLNHI